MRTLYLRNVPAEVVARLEILAERRGMSLSTLALGEFTEASRRADNPRLLADLPDHESPARPSWEVWTQSAPPGDRRRPSPRF
jgi:hypothetical protein